MLRLERHALGPRVYVLGTRVHEWQLGVALLAALLAFDRGDVVTGGVPECLLALAGCWFIAKDWRDLTPSRRDTGAWRVGFHRPPSSLRPTRHGDWVPSLAALLTAATAVASLVSTLAPNVAWHGHLVRRLSVVHTAAVFHAAVIPVAAALLVSSYSLWRRRARAFQLAFGLLLVDGVFNLVKGLDVREAALSFAAASLLWWGRASFVVPPRRLTPRAAIVGALALLILTAAVGAAAVASAASGEASVPLVARTTADLLLWEAPPLRFTGDFRFMPEAVGALGLLGLLACAWVLFRPLAPPLELPAEEERHRARDLVRAHGRDTLAYFKLREDKHYLWTERADAFLGYRIENGVLLVSGDPVGPDEALPELIRATLAYAERHSLRLGVVGASERLCRLYRAAGLKTLYLGDEAIVAPGEFSLEGRAVRKVRQSVHRLERLGFSVDVVEAHAAGATLMAELEEVSAAWRQGKPERGFSMALDRLGGPLQRETLIVLARDPDGAVAGFLQLVPSFGRAAMSLALMRRLPDSPNGLMEFLIVRMLEHLAAAGIEEVSLNFAAFGRFLRAPGSPLEHALGGLLRAADRWFQIERLERFNAKFSPRWGPRYLVYQGYTTLPRTAVAVMWVEGQAPKPTLALVPSRPNRRPGGRPPLRTA